MVKRGVGDQGVARRPGGLPHICEHGLTFELCR